MEAKKKKSLTETIRENPWVLSTFVFGVLAIVLIITSFGGQGVSSNHAGESFVDFINSQGGPQIELVKVEDFGSNLYKVTVLAEGQEIPIHVTRDGKYFAQGVIPLIEPEESENPVGNPDVSTTNYDVPKTDKPFVELFVMSHCPFGTQAEKGLLPVLELLGDKVDSKIRFVNYAMHPTQGEVQEQLNQYCIQEEQGDKYFEYLRCFLEAGDGETCLAEVEIDTDMLSSCYEETDLEFNVLANLEDTSSWLNGRFPKFMIDNELNLQYGVQGSPTFVVNGVKLDSHGRDAASYLKTVCEAFSESPEECLVEGNTVAPSPGFGWSGAAASGANTAVCG
jgi:hypothetical protein